MRWAAVVLLLLMNLGSVGAQTPEGQARSLLAGLTLEQKVGQLFLVYHSPADFMAENSFGGSLVMESMLRDPATLEASLKEADRLCTIPLLVAMDQEGGEINRMRPLPGFQEVASAEEMGLWSADSVRVYVQSQASRLRDLGVNLNLAPVLDPSLNVDYQPTLMKSRRRAFGSDSRSIVSPARGFMQGFSESQILCVVKHFPGYVVQENSDHEVAESLANRAALLGYVHPFAASMDLAGGVMMSSILFSFISDRPAVFDSSLVALARCGYADRLVMTDDLWGTALRSWVSGGPVQRAEYPAGDLKELTLLAFSAGNDMLMITYPAKAVLMKEILVRAIGSDREMEQRLDQSVYRVLLLKARLGLLGD